VRRGAEPRRAATCIRARARARPRPRLRAVRGAGAAAWRCPAAPRRSPRPAARPPRSCVARRRGRHLCDARPRTHPLRARSSLHLSRWRGGCVEHAARRQQHQLQPGLHGHPRGRALAVTLPHV
jgi:hypothetical protein